jgi:type IV secretory pathway TraG/TraD family ATPase VirD4
VYGADEAAAILENLQIKVVTEATGVDSQEYFSKLAGQIKVTKKRKTNRASEDTATTESKMERWEPKIRPEEFGWLKHKENKLVVFHHGEVCKLRTWPAWKDRQYLKQIAKAKKTKTVTIPAAYCPERPYPKPGGTDFIYPALTAEESQAANADYIAVDFGVCTGYKMPKTFDGEMAAYYEAVRKYYQKD